MRIELRYPVGIVDPDRLEHASARGGDVAASERWCVQQRLRDLRADRHHRIERELRILQDHRRCRCRGCRASAEPISASRSMPSNASLRGGHLAGCADASRGSRGRSSTCPNRIRRRCRAARAPAVNEMPLTTSSGPRDVGNVTVRSSMSSRVVIAGRHAARIEHVAQSVAEQVEAEADDDDRKARHGGHPPLVEDDERAARDHRAPFGQWAAGRRGRGSRGRRR